MGGENILFLAVVNISNIIEYKYLVLQQGGIQICDTHGTQRGELACSTNACPPLQAGRWYSIKIIQLLQGKKAGEMDQYIGYVQSIQVYTIQKRRSYTYVHLRWVEDFRRGEESGAFVLQRPI